MNAPVNTLKLRYLILRQLGSREEVLSKAGWCMSNQDKTYARVAYLKENPEK